MTEGEFEEALLLADSNMERDFEVNDLENSEVLVVKRNSRTKRRNRNGWRNRIPVLPCPHTLHQIQSAFLSLVLRSHITA